MPEAIPRIPIELQAVFLASNRGEEVNKPPPSAFRVFKKVFAKPFKRFQTRRNKKAARSSSICTVTSVPSSLLFNASDALQQANDYAETTMISPQAWVEEVLPGRGYNTVHISAAKTAYRNAPTKLQLASFNAKTVALSTCKRLDQVGPLRDILSCGISLNACNTHGETLMHKACRLGYHHILEVFIDLGAELSVCDAQGRTLLHDCCFGARPSFQTFSLLMRHAPDLLFMADARGACPLDYVQKAHYEFWIDYLDSHINRFWPCYTEIGSNVPPKISGAPNSRPIPNPVNALTPELALMVAAGRMEPEEARLLACKPSDCHDDDCSLSSHEDEEGSDDDSHSSFCIEGETALFEELGISLS